MAKWSLTIVWDGESLGPARVETLTHCFQIAIRELGLSKKSAKRTKTRTKLRAVTIVRIEEQ